MISVIIPIYNCKNFLQRLFDCIKKQTYTDLEILLIDDGSTDGSAGLCDLFLKEDSRVRVFHQKNSGVAVARNFGLKYAKGEYISFLDADDAIDENYYCELLNAIITYEADIAVCDVVREQDGKELSRFSGGMKVYHQQQALNELLTRRKINSGPCAKLFKQTIVEKLSFPEMKTYEDILFVLDAFLNAKTIISTNKTCYHYFMYDTSAMGKMKSKPSQDIIIATKKILILIDKVKKLKPECTYITISHLMQYIQFVRHSGDLESKLFLKQSMDLLKKYRKKILFCSAFPWKEKIVYILFTYGWLYEKRNIFKVEVK